MGFKRPLDDNKFHELPFKHSRQLGFNEKSMQFEEFIPRHVASQSPLATVNARPQVGETFDEESSFVYPGLDMEGCFDLCHGKDATHPAEYFELGLVPPRTLDPFETFYSVLLDQPARKQVPIGPDHQAILPEWEGSVNTNLEPLATSKLSGTCVVPMPALNMPDDSVGKGREFCVCQDMGSIRCVRQHVKEAREEVVKVHGFEKFRDLGFCDMGEEVTERWSDEDELLFHEVVYSNPVTLGRNFWKHLEAAFLSRTKHEIVSYYFNVFVLRRRATQNRCMMLDIDSDDDEWHGGYGGRPLGTQYDEGHEEEEEEEDSVIQSPLHQGTERYNEKVHPLYEREGEEDASISDNDEDDTRLLDEHKMDAAVEYMSTFFVCNEERLNVEDDSCTTLELAHDAVNSGWKKCANKEETGLEDEQKKVERV